MSLKLLGELNTNFILYAILKIYEVLSNHSMIFLGKLKYAGKTTSDEHSAKDSAVLLWYDRYMLGVLFPLNSAETHTNMIHATSALVADCRRT